MTPIPRLSAGAGSAQNAQHREKMEDAHSVLENFQNNPNQGFFAVYDGHAGAHTANWCQKYFHQEFLTILDKFNPLWPIPTILAETFIIGDKRLISQPGYDSSGSTASVVFIKSEDDGHSRTLYTANVGDSRIILCTNGRAEILSRDHNLEDKRENDRVRANGGFIARNRVDGMLAITRAIGDSGFKPYVSSSPYTTEIKLDQSQDEFVIIATDGLWDVCDNQTAVDLIRDIDDSDKASKLLIDYAMEHGSSDNITVIVIRLSDSI
ncbi:protein serine/threonine phosphatase 2C, partial [Nadsonia fulvescens var. elongata DSM 6958]